MASNRLQKALFVSGVLVLLGSSYTAFGGLVFGGPGAVTAQRSPSGAADSESSPAAQSAGFDPLHDGTAYTEGRLLEYAVDFGSRVVADKAKPDGQFGITGSARMSLLVEKVDQTGVHVQGRISRLSVVLENEENEGRHVEEMVGTGLARPFAIHLSPSGRILSLAVEPTVVGIGHNILRTVVAALQFVEPSDAKPDWKQWETEETDQNGTYRARYERVARNQFKKTKLTYTHLEMVAQLAATGQRQEPRVKASVDFVRAADGAISKAQSEESLFVPLGEAGLETETHTTLMLERSSLVATVQPLDHARLISAPLVRARLDGGLAEDAERKRRKDLIAGASFEELVSALEKTPTGDRDARNHLMVRLEALLDEDPSRIGDAVLRIRRASRADSEILLGALAGAQAPQAQSALIDLAQRGPQEVRSAAVTHLGLHDHPTEESLQALADLANEEPDPQTRAAAVLALGGATRRMEAGSDGPVEVTNTAVEQLTAGYRSADSPESRRLYLDALGNSGTVAAVAVARDALKSDDPGLRAAAIGAVRHVDAPEVDGLVATSLSEDPEDLVRIRAIRVAQERPYAEVTEHAAVEAIKTDEDAGIRVRLVGLLGDHLDSPASFAALQWSAQNDPSEDVRKAAQAVLARQQIAHSG